LDNLDHGWLIKFVEHRVADPRILRLIQKSLKAGVMEEGKWSEVQTGSPQGSVISPRLANIYLHYSFDLWVNVWRKKSAQGEVVVIRWWSSDMPMTPSWDSSIRRTQITSWKTYGSGWGSLGWNSIPTRRAGLSSVGLPNKTGNEEGKADRKTFDFLGFTHISGKNGLGRFMVRRTTIRKRMRAKLRQIKQQLRERMHDPVPQTGQWLQSIR
jgi:RNA-directed DNA polymerase